MARQPAVDTECKMTMTLIQVTGRVTSQQRDSVDCTHYLVLPAPVASFHLQMKFALAVRPYCCKSKGVKHTQSKRSVVGAAHSPATSVTWCSMRFGTCKRKNAVNVHECKPHCTFVHTYQKVSCVPRQTMASKACACHCIHLSARTWFVGRCNLLTTNAS